MSPPNAPNPTISRTTDPLSTASHLTHRELLFRRLRNTKRLIKHYRRMYWALIEQVRIKHRQYVAETGFSPFVIATSAAGPVTCQKPIMSSPTPSYCTVHMQKAEMHLAVALKKAGLNISPMGKVSPKFHELVPEFVRQIQAKRRAMRGKGSKAVAKKDAIDAKECEREAKKEDDIADE